MSVRILWKRLALELNDWVKEISPGQVPAAHACNPSYSGGRDQEDPSLKPAWVQIVCETLAGKNPSQERASGMIQGVGPEFKPQYHKREREKEMAFSSVGVQIPLRAWVEQKGKGRLILISLEYYIVYGCVCVYVFAFTRKYTHVHV
jgi:hypothetical protein